MKKEQTTIHLKLDKETGLLVKALAGISGEDTTKYIIGLIRREQKALPPDERAVIDRLQKRLSERTRMQTQN